MDRNKILGALLLFLILFSSSSAVASDGWGTFIPPNYPGLHWNGRFSLKKGIARFDWAQVGFHAKLDATACAIYLNPIHNEFNVYLDGQLKGIIGQAPHFHGHPDADLWLSPSAATNPVWVLQHLSPGPHLLEIDKRTGPNFGIAKFFGLRLNEGGQILESDSETKHRILFVGDSLTNAYGCEGASSACKELLPYENSRKSYAALAAREFDADYQLIALSGYGLVRNFGDHKSLSKDSMLDYQGRTISALPGNWDSSKFPEDALIIDLGSNDFWAKPFPDSKAFDAAMLRLLKMTLPSPDTAPVIVILNQGVEGLDLAMKEALAGATSQGYKVTELEFEQPGDSEMGCSAHPNTEVQARWARALELCIRKNLGWEPHDAYASLPQD